MSRLQRILDVENKKRGWNQLLPKRNKYNAKRTLVDAILFDSKRESERYQVLKVMQKAGLIFDLELQPSFPIVINGTQVRYGNGLGRPMVYKADFRYKLYLQNSTSPWLVVVEDAKGYLTAEFKIKRALVEHIYGIVVELV